jgi:pyrroloquinoline quinone biosynthesis protein B
MKIRVLGSGAGGGFPQWNCHCTNCAGWRKGTVKAHARTQSSIAVSSNQKDWLLVNASPDVLAQLRDAPELWGQRGQRDTGIAAILLVDAQIDHVTGLLMLREHQRSWPLYATAPVLHDLSQGFPLIHLLSHYCGVTSHELPLESKELRLPALPDIGIIPLVLSSKAPPYSPHRHDPAPGDNIGLTFIAPSGKRLFYAPGLGEIDPATLSAMQAADVVLVDGTFWHDNEMIDLGLSTKHGLDMGHLSQSGPGGMIEILDSLGPKRKILIHINNTNPILREDSPERAELTAHGIEVAWDGMEIEL